MSRLFAFATCKSEIQRKAPESAVRLAGKNISGSTLFNKKAFKIAESAWSALSKSA